MTNRMIFYPIIQLTVNEQMLSAKPAERFFSHITIPSVVDVVKIYQNVAEVQFPCCKETDLVSVDYLHETDSPEISILTKMTKEQR